LGLITEDKGYHSTMIAIIMSFNNNAVVITLSICAGEMFTYEPVDYRDDSKMYAVGFAKNKNDQF
jgi:hypothetical protein